MNKQSLPKFFIIASVCLSVLTINAQESPAYIAGKNPQSILFIGNSFTFAHGSPVMYYHPQTVTDLNNTKIGGVPALFKTFTLEAGLDFNVSLETSPGKNLDFHLKEKAGIIGKPWDCVVMHGYSTLDKDKPGDPTELIQAAKELAMLLRSKNAKVAIHLVATWARADQVYLQSGHWYGQTIEKMALDIRKGYDAAAAKAAITDVIPVGQAWNRAIKTGVADPNPYDGTNAGQVDLWTNDHYHGSAYGYYIEALMDFGSVTGLDPQCLGKKETAATELGFTTEQTIALQKVAHDELAARKGFPPLKLFKVPGNH